MSKVSIAYQKRKEGIWYAIYCLMERKESEKENSYQSLLVDQVSESLSRYDQTSDSFYFLDPWVFFRLVNNSLYWDMTINHWTQMAYDNWNWAYNKKCVEILSGS